MTEAAGGYRAGIVAIAGRPNVGKSTLLNQIMGEPVVIVSPRPQTTRHRITCIHTRPEAQLVFLDTPGLTLARDPLHRFMQSQAHGALAEVDAILLVLDMAGVFGHAEEAVIDLVRKSGPPCVVALNKIDRVSRDAVRETMGRLGKDPFWEDLVPISGLTGEQVEELVGVLVGLVPESPQLYPGELRIDASEQFVVAETIREQVFIHTREEVPHATAVLIEQMDESQAGVLRISAVIYVERDTQKAIVIGKGGERLKAIGTAARRRIERLLATRVYLGLHVRVRKRWRSRDAMLRELGYVE